MTGWVRLMRDDRAQKDFYNAMTLNHSQHMTNDYGTSRLLKSSKLKIIPISTDFSTAC
jgi:hypothetical protein